MIETSGARIPAQHFPSNRGASPTPVEVVAKRDGLDLSSGARWPYASIRISTRGGTGESVTIEREAFHEVLVFADRRILAAIREASPEHRDRFRDSRTGGKFNAIVVGAGLLLLIVMAVAYFRGIPALAGLAAQRVPPEWEARVGSAMRDALAPASRRVEDPALSAVIDTIVSRLDAHAPEHPYTFRVTIVRSDEVNALAAPGGELVFYTGLLEKTKSPEELAGVMAHEMQHVLERHATKGILRRMSTGALLAFFVGDAGALTGVVDAARELGDLAYGRGDELEADREGLELMRSAGIDPRAMVRMFESLAESEPDTPRAFRYLSTHPATEERIRRMNEALDQPVTIEPIPTPEDWEGLLARVARGS